MQWFSEYLYQKQYFQVQLFFYDLIFTQVHVQTLTLCAKIRAG